ncbi:MAG: ATP-binding protein [Candidatus Pelethousia sp.]|nr:ATP-binding protein [Candidatus Pelethousia sp.]
MKRNIFLFSAFLAGLAVLVSSILITLAAYQDFFRTIKQEVAAEAAYIRTGIEFAGAAYLERMDPQSHHRITVIAADGTVLFDSMSDPGEMDNHLDRSEVQAALATGMGESTRFSDTLQEQTYYYAVRLADGSVLRVASFMDSAIASYSRLLWLVALIAAGVFLLCAGIASLVTRRIVRPINTLDLDHPENNVVYEEIVPLLMRIKKQRSEIGRQMEELDRRRMEFSAITENMNEGFLILNQNGKVLSYNKSALKLLNTPMAQPMGTHILALNRSEAFRDMMKTALAGMPRERIVELGGRQCQVFASPVKREDSVQGVVLLMLDVTERQEREKLRREFTANVSHELKTPLTSISGYAEIMLHGLVKPEDAPEFLQNIYTETQRLIALVKDLMLLSKLEEDASPPRESIDVFALTREVEERLKKKAAEHGVSVSVSGDSARILGIPSVLEEMIYNLLENAIKYNRPGGTASVTVKKENGEVLLAVADTGIGIPKAEQSRIFERFYRVDKSHNEAVEGTGLGLAIVKHGVALHEGRIRLKSGPQGSTFTLRFPAL